MYLPYLGTRTSLSGHMSRYIVWVALILIPVIWIPQFLSHVPSCPDFLCHVYSDMPGILSFLYCTDHVPFFIVFSFVHELRYC